MYCFNFLLSVILLCLNVCRPHQRPSSFFSPCTSHSSSSSMMVVVMMIMAVVMMIANNGPHTRAVARVGPSYRLTEATNIITPSHFSALLLRILPLLLLSQPSSIKHSTCGIGFPHSVPPTCIFDLSQTTGWTLGRRNMSLHLFSCR